MAKENIIEMEEGKMYFINFGGGTQLVVRYKNQDACNYFFYDHLHYWNGHENFYKNKCNYCVKSGIEEIRLATVPEKYLLFRNEIENNCI